MEIILIISSHVLNIVEAEPGVNRDSALNKETLDVNNKG